MAKPLKIALIGVPETGKSSLLLKLQQRDFEPIYSPTLASDMVLKEFTVRKEDVPITYAVQFWEICNMTSIGRSFLRGTHGLILVVDLSSRQSLDGIDALYGRVKVLANFNNDNFPCVLVGNKADIDASDREVSMQDMMSCAKRLRPNDPDSIRCFETSAKDGRSVDDMFIHIFERVLLTPTSIMNSPANSTQPNTPLRSSSPYHSPTTFGAYRTPHTAQSNAALQTPYSKANEPASVARFSVHSELDESSPIDRLVSHGSRDHDNDEDEDGFKEGSTIIEPSEVGVPESKVIFCGAPCVGKSSLLDRYLDGSQWNNEYNATNGMDFRRVQLSVKEQMVFLNIWDVAGNPQYLEQSKNMFRDADCLVLVYDITSEQSFDSLDLYWDFFMQHAMPSDPDEFPVLLLGNKSDLSDRRAVTLEEVLEWCTAKRPRKPITYIECSARHKIGIVDAFVFIGDAIYDYAQRELSAYDDEDDMDDTGEYSNVNSHSHNDGHSRSRRPVDHSPDDHNNNNSHNSNNNNNNNMRSSHREYLRDHSISSTPTAAKNPDVEKSCWFNMSCLAFRMI